MSILDKRLILVCGKGGVGRSTVAAALAAASARRGRNTLLFETMATDRVGGYFGRPPLGPELVSLAPSLSAVNTTPAAALEEYGMMILKFRTVYEMVFENRVTRAFLRAIPGLDDYALLGKAWFHTTEERRGRPVWDTVVFDLPASGHSLSLLRIPWVIVDTVPEGPLTRDARSVQALLTDRARTAVVMVTLAEEMPAVEAQELAARMGASMGLRPHLLVVNQLYPERFAEGAPADRVLTALAEAGAAADDRLRPLVEHAALARSRRRLNEQYLAQLARTVAAPQVHLPRLFASPFGRPQLDALSRLLEAADAAA